MKKYSGFTLIELSVVIVIIGLIVAGVVGGQSLVQQAKLRGLVSDINKHEIALNTFKLEYDAIPGDFVRASNYGLGNDGNGDKQITNGTTVPETLCVSDHLSSAGLIEGSYTCPGSYGSHAQIDDYVPKIGYSDNVFFYYHHAGPPKASSANYFFNGLGALDPIYLAYSGNTIGIGSVTDGGRPISGFLTVKDSVSLDSKIDDGGPGAGRVLISRGWYDAAGTCTDKHIRQALPVALNYSDTGKTCRLFYRIE